MTVLGNGGGATQEVSGSELDKEPMDEMTVPARLPYRGIRNTSRQIYFEFLVSKLTPLTNFIKDLVSSFNSASESFMQFVRGSSFDKLEFKINLAESVSYPPVYGSKVQQLLDVPD